jgi:hypothetical protein
MRDREAIDFSALETDPKQWQAFKAATLAQVSRVLDRRATPSDPLSLLASWKRTILTAVAILFLVLVPVEFALERRERTEEPIQALVQASGEAAWGGQQPASAAELLRVVGRGRLR